MKTLKANNFAQAKKELKELSKKQANSLSDDIKHGDRKHYHAICARIETVEGQAKNKVTINVVKMHKQGFERLAKNFLLQGIAQLILLHDPSQLEEEEAVMVPSHTRESVEQRVRREMKDQHTKEIEDAVADGVKKALKEQADAKEKEDEEKDNKDANNTGSKADLKDEYDFVVSDGLMKDIVGFAEANNVDLTGAKNNDERVAKITAWWDQLEA